MTSASLLIVLLVGTVVGAVTGLFLGGMNADVLAILAGFLGAVIGATVRNFIVARGAGVGPDNSRTPGTVIAFAAVASLAAGMRRKGGLGPERGRLGDLDRSLGGSVRVDPGRDADDRLSHPSRREAEAPRATLITSPDGH